MSSVGHPALLDAGHAGRVARGRWAARHRAAGHRYVNLERPHVRAAHTVLTSDRVLDLVVAPDRSMTRKDEDELVLAVEQGVFTAAEAAAYDVDLREVEGLVEAWGSPFSDGWERFRPDPDWPVPDLTEAVAPLRA